MSDATTLARTLPELELDNSLLPLLDLAAWAEREPPERAWALNGFIPWGQATYVTGPGSAGKSLLGQQYATCSSLALRFMGVGTRFAPALYVTCEDGADELERRQKAVCEALGVDRHSIDGKLRLSSLQGEVETALATFSASGRMLPSALYRRLEATALHFGSRLVVLDNVAHFFGGNENSRSEVAAFIHLLNRLALTIDGCVLLVGHPNKAGAEWSGSTAWENQVRSRLFLQIENADIDPDARVLTAAKANYARTGERLRFHWHKGAFVREQDLPPDYRQRLQVTAEAAAENEAYMRCLAAATAIGRAVSHNPGSNYAPKIFGQMPEAQPFTREAFERAQERLLHLRRIAIEQRLWQRSNRHWQIGIAAVETASKGLAQNAQVIENIAPSLAPTPCADQRQTPSQVIENIAPKVRASPP